MLLVQGFVVILLALHFSCDSQFNQSNQPRSVKEALILNPLLLQTLIMYGS